MGHFNLGLKDFSTLVKKQKVEKLHIECGIKLGTHSKVQIFLLKVSSCLATLNAFLKKILPLVVLICFSRFVFFQIV